MKQVLLEEKGDLNVAMIDDLIEVPLLDRRFRRGI
jgi:hypothetical protein